MGKEKLTDKQTQILEYIRHEILAKGYPPSIREICQAVDLKSTSSVHAQLSSLEAKGYIRRDLTKSRSIEIIDDDFSLTKRELVNIPIVGTVSCGQPILAEQNIEEHGLIHNVIPIRSDLFRDLPKVQYDLIVTNPPYVDAEDMSDLPNEYRHEPELGLASGTDGLKLTRRILGNAADYLADDGVLICEVGNSMVHLMEQYPDVPFTWLEFDNGGDGVFMLTKEQLLAAREHFAIYKD